jgi:UDP-glucose 4-epimerase
MASFKSWTLTNYRLNVAATHEVCEAARLNGVKRIVFGSSAAVYGACDNLPLKETAPTIAISQYGAAKRISEQILASYGTSYGLDTTSLRFFNVYGPRQDPKSPYSGVVSIFCDRFLDGHAAKIFGDGSQSRDFVYVSDIAQLVALAATSPEPAVGIFNCCTGRPTSLLDLVAILGATIPGVPAPVHEPPRVGDIEHSHGDPSALEEAVGLKLDTPLAVGLEALVNSLRP